MNDRMFWAILTITSILVIAYSVLIEQALLSGIIAVCLFVLVTYVARQIDIVKTLGGRRTIAITVLSLFILGYALLIKQTLLLGIIVTSLMWLVAYVTHPRSSLV